jgi:hypothetical protein
MLGRLFRRSGPSRADRDMLRQVDRLIASRPACDSVPGGAGAFGTTPTNPIPVCRVDGQYTYLQRLRAGPRKAPVIFHRVGSVDSQGGAAPVDLYEVLTIDGSMRANLYFDMYYPRNSEQPPAGFSLVDPASLNDVQRSLLPMPWFGTNSRVDDFPRGLPAVIKAGMLEGGMPEDMAEQMVAPLRIVLDKMPA